MHYKVETSSYVLDDNEFRFTDMVANGWVLVTIVSEPDSRYLNTWQYHYYWRKEED